MVQPLIEAVRCHCWKIYRQSDKPRYLRRQLTELISSHLVRSSLTSGELLKVKVSPDKNYIIEKKNQKANFLKGLTLVCMSWHYSHYLGSIRSNQFKAFVSYFCKVAVLSDWTLSSPHASAFTQLFKCIRVSIIDKTASIGQNIGTIWTPPPHYYHGIRFVATAP